ncbi:hypothetical protein CH372_19155 [Leptospira meyeri]|uniref:hypothetical protein n=1 Tax=Leptospira meyeri TaxID=29508 RepID=UPI000C2A0280|nr:hypothetical protein [Leptospira meyeri]PKA10487.1 hypothetical protein CH372_19155 [Leptospira meyeri]
MPPKNSIDILTFEYIDLYLDSDLPLLAKTISKICERNSSYSHVRTEKLKAKILSFTERFENSQWSYIDSFSPKSYSKVTNARIELISQFDSFVIAKFSFQLQKSMETKFRKILRQRVKNNIVFNLPRLKYLFKFRYASYSFLSETEILTDRARRFLSSESKKIQKKLLSNVPNGLLKKLTGNWLECKIIGVIAEDEEIRKGESAFYTDIFPFRSENYEVFKDNERTIVFSLPNEKWDLQSANNYFLFLRSTKNTKIPDSFQTISIYKSQIAEEWHYLPIICVKDFIIFNYRKLISEHKSKILALRSTNFLWKIFSYYKFQKSFIYKFRYFDTILSEILFKKRNLIWPESTLSNSYEKTLDSVIENKSKYYSKVFLKYYKSINNDLKSTIQETTQTLLLILTVVAVILTILQLIISLN